MATATLEERVAALEAELAKLKDRKNDNDPERPGVIGRTNPQLIEKMFGHFADSTNFEEVTRFIEAERERERHEAEMQGDSGALPS